MSHPSTWLKQPSAKDPAHGYLGVRDILAARIEAGHFGQSERLPSERQMQSSSGAARGTIRAALFQLEAEGLIYRKDRSGWYVAPPPVVYDPTRGEGFISYVSAQGRTPRTETLSLRLIEAPQIIAENMNIRPGSALYEVRRRRYIDERSVLLETIHVEPQLTPGLGDHDLNGSFTSALRDHYGVTIASNRIEMQPCALTQDVAAALRIKPGLPGLLIKRVSYDGGGRAVEYDIEYWRHDALKITVEANVGI